MTYKKLVGASQATLNLGRNRDHRILEARLDGVKEVVVGATIGLTMGTPLCEYNEGCNVRIHIGKEKCSINDADTCRTHKFKSKYEK